MAKKKRRGHYCRVCGRQRANEKFSGKGHARHICRDCEREQRRSRRERKKAKAKHLPIEKRSALLTPVQVEMLCAWLAGLEGCNFQEDEATGEVMWDCDHSLRLTRRWLQQAGLDMEANVRRLNDNGSYCDCEVVFNALQHWPED